MTHGRALVVLLAVLLLAGCGSGSFGGRGVVRRGRDGGGPGGRDLGLRGARPGAVGFASTEDDDEAVYDPLSDLTGALYCED